MKRSYGIGLIISAVFALLAGSAGAQITANGPYYATPSWDQTLPSSTRFIVLSNMNSDAVLDRETGLVWEKSPDATPGNWYDAQLTCMDKTVGNRDGWRLPTVQEVKSLVDRTRPTPALPAGNPFPGVQSDGYWSATTRADDAARAWDVF